MLTARDPLPHAPRRIAVAGVSGSGKSTLCRHLATATGYPYTEIDGLFHGPDWTPLPTFLDDVRNAIAPDRWIIEWQYTDARPLILERCDLLVWVDPPFWTTTFPQVVRRTARRSLTHEELWNGNREAPLRTIFTEPDHIIRWAVQTRHKVAEDLAAALPARPDLPVVRLRSRSDVGTWLRSAFPH